MSTGNELRVSVEEATRVWNQVIDPKGIGMPEAIATELGHYTGEPVDVVLDKMAGGKKAFSALWNEQAIDVNDPEAVRAFYRDQFVEAYELADWHCGRTNGFPPLNYARAIAYAQKTGARRVLDFGSGIGSGTVGFADIGCQVDSADIAVELMKFVADRMQQRGHQARMIDLNQGRPPHAEYDVITCFDVLEHIADQLGKLRELESYLKPGGVLFVNLMDDSSDDERPMHISSAKDWLALVRRTGLVPKWDAYYADCQVLQRRPMGRWINRVGYIVDSWQKLGTAGA